MSEINSLLPDNATPHEIALARSIARISAVPVPIRDLWNVETCPVSLLTWLAWSNGVDEWAENWPEDVKRATLREAIKVQRKKGSVWSVKRVLQNAGYGTAQLIEGLYGVLRDGSQVRNGFVSHGDPTQWATYRAVLDRPISNGQADQVRRLLAVTAPARCKLLEFVFTQANNLHDGALTRNGAFNRGTA